MCARTLCQCPARLVKPQLPSIVFWLRYLMVVLSFVCVIFWFGFALTTYYSHMLHHRLLPLSSIFLYLKKVSDFWGLFACLFVIMITQKLLDGSRIFFSNFL